MSTMVERLHPDIRAAAATAPAAARLVAVIVVSASLVGCVPTPAVASRSPGSPTANAPTPEPTPAGPTPTPSFIRPTPTPLPTFLVYVVQPGDSLWTVAQRIAPEHDTREVVAQIQRLNDLDGATLQVGQLLLLPTSV